MKDFKITNVTAREIFNAIWIPTVEVTVEVDSRHKGTAIAPMGQSTGAGEAAELRDGGKRFEGTGCLKALANVQGEIRDALLGMDVTRQRDIDFAMIALDGTPNKSRLGANAVGATSAAVAKAAAAATGLPVYRYLNSNARVLPVPMFSILEGGHYAFGDSSEIQEFLVFPEGATSMAEAVALTRSLYFTLAGMVSDRFGPLAKCVNAGGGFSLPMRRCREILDFLMQAIDASGLSEVFTLGLDCASSQWYDKDAGVYNFEGGRRSREEMLDFYKGLVRDYPLVSIEDPFEENDVDGFVQATHELGIQVVGDDFFVTNPALMRERIPTGAANAMLWKYNQVGSLSEAFDAAELACRSGYGVMTSTRSGESEDTLLADLTVAIAAGQLKTGVCVRSEQAAKYNCLIQIEEELAGQALYAGHNYKNPFMD